MGELLQIPAEVVGSGLFQEFVQKPIHGATEIFHININPAFPIGRKLRLYQFASVLLAVMQAEVRDKAFCPVRESLERQFFPSTFSEGAELLEEVRGAMKDLATLIEPSGEPHRLSWAHEWFISVGVGESNPATLALFGMCWFDHYIAVAKSLLKCKPT